MIYSSWDIEQHILKLVILTYFFPFTPLKTPKIKILKNEKKHMEIISFYHKLQSYDVWFLRYGVRHTEFFVTLDCFLPFYPPTNPENQNFEKMKKNIEDIINLHMCTINDNHMMYGSWEMECDRQTFLSFWTFFCIFTPPNNPKNQNFEKMKKTPWDIIILHRCTVNDNHMM